MQTIEKGKRFLQYKMYKNFYLVSLVCLILFLTVSSLFSLPVSFYNDVLYVNNQPFIIKGVCYESIPVGETSTSYKYEIYPYAYENDFKLIREMGANCIRTYTDFDYPDIMDSAYKNGLYVIMQYPIPYNTSFTSHTIRTQVLNGIKSMVLKWKDHPALLMWVIGNEVSFNINCSNNQLLINSETTNRLKSWYKFLNEIASNIHVWESPSWHPVATTEPVQNSTNFGLWQGIEIIGNPDFYADDNSLKYLDVWGVQTYQGNGFTSGFFDKYKSLSQKPLWISETGCDAYDAISHQENQKKQREYIQTQWEQIQSHLSINSSYPCIGVTFFQWADGWYKYSDGSVFVHDTNGSWQNPYYYDYSSGVNNMNEEWWGLVAIFPGTFKRYPRSAYYYLKSVWNSDRADSVLNQFLLKSEPVALPNPVCLSKRDLEIYVYLNSEAEVKCKIFDFSGRLIKEITSYQVFPGYTYLLKWNGKDYHGNSVKAGIYLCKIIATKNIDNSSHRAEKIIKIMVKR